jgi:aryl-alcohol dehydrogenase-like predicted oxidoreductase
VNYRNLGRTGVKVSPLCLGCMNFGGRTEPKDSAAIIDRALDEGVNFFDTANIYNDGRSEEVVGKALKDNGRREEVVLATKVHGRMGKGPNMRGNHRRHILQQCEASLKRLQTDWIDLYQIHRPESDTPFDETLRALDDLIRAGKVRYIGTSTFAAWQVVETLWTSKELGLNRFVTEQPPYHLLDRRIERELVPMAETFGVGLIPWSPLAGGFLTGKYKRGQEPPENARLRKDKHGVMTDAAFDVAERVEQIAETSGCSPSQVALSWCMNRPGITSPIIGPRTMDQLEDNLGALRVELTDGHLASLDEVAPPGRCIAEFYEADFGPDQYRPMT